MRSNLKEIARRTSAAVDCGTNVGSKKRAGTHEKKTSAPTATTRRSSARPSFRSNSENHDVGTNDAPRPFPDSAAVTREMCTATDSAAATDTVLNQRSATSYSAASTHTNLMNSRPPNRALTVMNAMRRASPTGPPRRRSPVSSEPAAVVPGTVVWPGSVGPTVVVGWVWDSNEKLPVEPSASFQLTVHVPLGGTCVSAADTVSPSAPSCGVPRPTSRPEHVSASPICATCSAVPAGRTNRSCN